MRKIHPIGLTLLIFFLVFTFVGQPLLAANAEGENAVKDIIEGPVNDVLTYLYTIAAWTGDKIRVSINTILPEKAHLPDGLSDPLGILVLLTAFMAVAEVAKRVTWFLVVAGWVLIFIRMGMIIAGSYI